MNSLGTKVALVDDSPVFRNGIHEILTMWGYEVVLTAIHGKDLLRQLTAANAPDICITDLNMPVMNGYETIAALREKWPGIKVIAFLLPIAAAKNCMPCRQAPMLLFLKQVPLSIYKRFCRICGNLPHLIDLIVGKNLLLRA